MIHLNLSVCGDLGEAGAVLQGLLSDLGIQPDPD